MVDIKVIITHNSIQDISMVYMGAHIQVQRLIPIFMEVMEVMDLMDTHTKDMVATEN
jgi:hypothetical protein